MEPASLSFWLNVAIQQFAGGPTDASPYFAPLPIAQYGKYEIDIYFVEATYNALAPWTYIDPALFTSAVLIFGNRFSFATYASANTFTRLSDNFGPKARFSVTLSNAQLTTDLTSLAAVVALMQVNWQSATDFPCAQLYTIINKSFSLAALLETESGQTLETESGIDIST